MKKLILTHHNCVDGCCCKSILMKNYIEVKYSDFNPEYKEEYKNFKEKVIGYNNTEVIMADICLS